MRYPLMLIGLCFAHTCLAGTGLPIVTGVSPNTGVFAGGTVVTITGSGFAGPQVITTSVSFGGTPVLTNMWSAIDASTITAIAPAGTGTVDIIVTTEVGTSAASSADQYTYMATPVRLQDFHVD